jgi:hypothetical protein
MLVAAIVTLLAAVAAGANAPYFGNNVHPRFANVLTDKGLPAVTRAGNAFRGELLNEGIHSNNTIPAGQDIRLMVYTAYLANVTLDTRTARRDKVLPFSGLHAPSNFRLSALLKLGNYTLLPAYNVSGPSPVRVRVITAYASREIRDVFRRDVPVQCTQGNKHDVWYETWAMAPRNLAFGRQMVFSSFTTFTAPPFHWRLCIKDSTRRNASVAGDVIDAGVNSDWREFVNFNQRTWRYNKPLYLWRTPTATSEAGDYGSIEIVAMWDKRRLLRARTYNASKFSLADSVKLVPAGFPCTYEKPGERIDRAVSTNRLRTDQYCGSNVVHPATGDWLQTLSCELEGSVRGGVARIGTRSQNPFATDTAPPTDFITSTQRDLDTLVAYLQFPDMGDYDVCVSTRDYRRARYNNSVASYRVSGRNITERYARNAVPLWFKAYAAGSSDCALVSSNGGWSGFCNPKRSFLTVTNVSASVTTWSTTDETPNTWGEIMFTAVTGTLNFTASTAWDHSATRSYTTHEGGDQFRLVPEDRFAGAPAVVAGDLTRRIEVVTAKSRYSKTTAQLAAFSATVSAVPGTLLTTSGEGKSVQYALGMPTIGTRSARRRGAGCWWSGSDNYGSQGLNGAPGAKCCSSAPCSTNNWCSLTDSDNAGPTASADLGGNPRIGYSPWNVDGTGANAWAYIRVPPAGRYRVCYRRAGGNWKMISGTHAYRTTSNATFSPRPLTAGYTYHFNDTRAETWGPLAVTSRAGATLDKLAWTYYTSTAASVAGSALKIVTTSQSCYTAAAQSRTFTMDPGSQEAVGTAGSADDSATPASTIYFYVRVPTFSASTRYRICFRRGAANWHALSDPGFRAHQYMTSASEFGPRLAPSLSFRIPTPVEAGMWGKLVFNRSTNAAPALNAIGDVVRLVPNTTAGGVQVGCDVVYTTTSTNPAVLAKLYDAERMTSRVGVACSSRSTDPTSDCYTGTLTPTSDGVNGNFPYTDINILSDSGKLTPADGTVAFMKIPSPLFLGRPVSYRVCYKTARYANWVEAIGDGFGSVLTVQTARSISFTPITRYSGQYTYIPLTASASRPIQWSTDIVKLVEFALTCDAPVAANAGYHKYSAMSGTSATLTLVDATNASTILSSHGQPGTTTTARAYLTIPVPAERTGQTLQYRVCYMARTSSATVDANWHDLSGTNRPLIVEHQAVAYTVTNAPRVFGTLGIRFISAGYSLDTRANGDSAKLIPSSAFCVPHGTIDYPAASLNGINHQGQEPNAVAVGVTDFEGSDAFPSRTADMTVVLNGSSYKVCYKVAGYPWVEVIQAPVKERIYSLSTTTSIIVTAATDVTSFTLNPVLAGQPGATDTYYGLSWGSVALGGASTSYGSSYFTLTYNAAQAGGTDILRLVRTHREAEPGVFVYVPGQNCFSSGRNYTYDVSSGSSTANWRLNLPLQSGRYAVCVYVTTRNTWYQVPADPSGAFTQPFTVISPQHAFSVTGAGSIRVVDYYGRNGTNMGGLVGTDYIYIINASAGAGVCGDDVNFEDRSIADSRSLINGSLFGLDTASFLAQRDAIIRLPSLSQAYMVCLRRTQATNTNASGVAPFVYAGWYQLPNQGTTMGGSSDYLVVGQAATKLNISGCPIYNQTYRLRAGSAFDVTVSAQDASSSIVPFATGTARYAAQAVGSGYALQNYGGDCAATDAPSFGYTSGALTQFMEDGRVRFRVTALSACPVGGCSLAFTSPDGLTSSPVCSFDVQPTTLKAVRIISLVASCAMETWCPIRVVAIHADDGVAYTINSAVSILAAGAVGMTVQGRIVSTGATFYAGVGGGAVFTNGILDAEIRFVPASFSTIASTSTVSITAAANGQTSSAFVVTVDKPIASEVHVVDLYPVDNTGAPILPLQPTWEPSYVDGGAQVFRGDGNGLSLGGAVLSAGPGYHIVAGQFYTAVLRVAGAPSGSPLRYITNAALVDSSISVSIASVATISGTSCTVPTCTTGVSSQQLQPIMTFTFRVNSPVGCPNGVCDIRFLFNGGNINLAAPTTRILTPIRSIATRFVVRCATSLSALATAVAGAACPSSFVNRGWYLNVTAVDRDGNIDSFFDGDVLAVLASTAKPTSGAKLTTVAALESGTTASSSVSVRAAGGLATFNALTFTRPCTGTGCAVQLISAWGVEVLDLGSLQATPNTQRLQCSLDTTLAYCTLDSDGNCATIAGVSAANVTNANSLVYKDTSMCVNVRAVDINGNPTLYETNWVLYYAQDAATSSKQSLTIRDENANTDFVRRYKAMSRSAVRFCFTVSGSFTSFVNFNVYFVAQRFNAQNYWSQGATGMCNVGALRAWAKKKVARIGVSSATGLEVITTGPQAVLSGEKTGSSALTVLLDFSPFDHYGVAIPSTDLATADAAYRIAIATNTGVVDILTQGSSNLRGVFNATATAVTRPLSAAVSFTLSISQYCLGCSLGFSLQDSTGAAVSLRTLTSPVVATPVTANASLYIVNTRPTASRMLSFHPGTSPLASGWVNGTALGLSTNTGPTTHVAACVATTCKPNPKSFNLAKCDARGVTYFGASATTPLRMRVVTVDPGFALSSVFEPANANTQIDITNTYTVTASFGNQLMECLTTNGGQPCVDDGTTAPKQIVAAYGSTIRAAVTAFGRTTDAAIRATSFFMVGLTTPSFLAVNRSTARLSGSAAPDVHGEFNASASSSTVTAVTPITMITGNEFYWRPRGTPANITVLDVARDANPCGAQNNSTYACYGGLNCSTAGLAQSASVTDGLAFNYAAQPISTNVPFPITVDVLDEEGYRVGGAGGAMSIAVDRGLVATGAAARCSRGRSSTAARLCG